MLSQRRQDAKEWEGTLTRETSRVALNDVQFLDHAQEVFTAENAERVSLFVNWRIG
jgi:hypothetical protein